MVAVIWHLIVTVVLNICMFCVYKFNHPFFEQYKSSYDKWPWEKDKKDWNKKLLDSIKLLCFNSLVIVTVSKYFQLLIRKLKETESYDFSTLPST